MPFLAQAKVCSQHHTASNLIQKRVGLDTTRIPYQKKIPGHPVPHRGNRKFPGWRGCASANHIFFPALARRNIQILTFPLPPHKSPPIPPPPPPSGLHSGALAPRGKPSTRHYSQTRPHRVDRFHPPQPDLAPPPQPPARGSWSTPNNKMSSPTASGSGWGHTLSPPLPVLLPLLHPLPLPLRPSG
jgi:hypothetical protein